MKNSSYYRLTILSIFAILAFSIFTPTLVYAAAPLANDGKDWQYVNGNSWAWNYSPQTQINKDNVNNLEVKWIFPIGSKALAPSTIQSLSLSEGTTTPPIVHNGVVYVLTNYKRIYAVDAKTGKQLWTHDYTINLNASRQQLPVTIATVPHSHGIRYWAGGDALLDYGLACDIYAVDAKTGKDKFDIGNLCANVPGNLYKYGWGGLIFANNIGTYEKGHEFIVVLPGGMHSTLTAPDARHVTLGISMDAPYNVLWRVFSFPPQGIPTKDWALQECNIGFFRDTPCTEVAAKNQAGLEWDWAQPGQPPSQWGGVTANWGQPVVDEDTGIVYTQTGNQGPYSNLTMTPGPRLYGSTIMAIDMNKGARAWWLQPFPHDLYDYDCNWSGMLIDSQTLGKVYVKGCKEGIFYVMDAATGKPKYKVDVIPEQVARGQVGPTAAKSPPDGIRAYAPDPTSFHDMREFNWISYPAAKPGDKGEHFTLPANIYPAWTNGVFATDMSYDPQSQQIILYEDALQRTVVKENPYIQGINLFTVQNYPIANSTIVARDLATGKAKWTYFYSYSHQRAAMVVSGGMVFTGFTDGKVRFLDKDSGKLLREMNIGSPVVVGVTIGADSAGDSKIFLMGGSAGIAAGDPRYGLGGQSAVPGSIIAIGLSDKAATSATATTTATTTQSTTITTTATTTATTATTITSTQPAQTTTVTSQVTQTTGLPSEVTYAVAAVAVIAIIAAAFLAMRKR